MEGHPRLKRASEAADDYDGGLDEEEQRFFMAGGKPSATAVRVPPRPAAVPTPVRKHSSAAPTLSELLHWIAFRASRVSADPVSVECRRPT